MKTTIIVILSLFVSFHSLADCSGPYKDQIKSLEGRMNTPRSALITNIVGEGALIGGLIAFTGTVTPAAVLALPAAAVGAATYFTVLTVQRNGLRNAEHLIRDAHQGKGKTLNRFMKILEKKSKEDLAEDDVINFIVQSDFDKSFCQQNENTDRYNLASFRKILRMTKKHFTNVDDVSLEAEEGNQTETEL